jgi:hypothetical protein
MCVCWSEAWTAPFVEYVSDVETERQDKVNSGLNVQPLTESSNISEENYDLYTNWHRHALWLIYSYVRFRVLTAASLKMTVFWYVAAFSLVDTGQRFRGAYCLYHHRLYDGGSVHLWNVG